MPKEPYIRPEVESETLEPEALCGTGSGAGDFTNPGNTTGNGGCLDWFSGILSRF